jgi:hypothetical protein
MSIIGRSCWDRGSSYCIGHSPVLLEGRCIERAFLLLWTAPTPLLLWLREAGACAGAVKDAFVHDRSSFAAMELSTCAQMPLARLQSSLLMPSKECQDAEWMLQAMLSDHKTGRLKGPCDTNSDTSTINTFAIIGNSVKAEALPEEMYKDYLGGKNQC